MQLEKLMKAPNAKPSGKTAQSQEQHTKGPWKISGTGFVVADDKVLATDISEANARRIVACVNACVEYSTEFLERGGLRSGIKGGAQAEATLAAQNIELVEALKLAQVLRPKMLKDFGYVPEYVLDFCNNARALLAKAQP